MKRLLPALLVLLAPLLSWAADEAPVEKASGTTVVVFLVLFIGSIAAYGLYLWWKSRNKGTGEQ